MKIPRLRQIYGDQRCLYRSKWAQALFEQDCLTEYANTFKVSRLR